MICCRCSGAICSGGCWSHSRCCPFCCLISSLLHSPAVSIVCTGSSTAYQKTINSRCGQDGCVCVWLGSRSAWWLMRWQSRAASGRLAAVCSSCVAACTIAINHSMFCAPITVLPPAPAVLHVSHLVVAATATCGGGLQRQNRGLCAGQDVSCCCCCWAYSHVPTTHVSASLCSRAASCSWL